MFVTDLGGGGFDVSSFVSTDGWFHGHLHISEYSRQVAGHTRSNNARVILGGVDTTRFSPGGEPGDGVLFVGRILPHKGIHDLIDAIPADVPLRIVGKPMNEEYLAALRERARGKQVTFVHDADDGALVDEYRRAACVVLPSVYTTPDGRTTQIPELLGQTLLEAMACARPVICTDVASMPEVVVHGEQRLGRSAWKSRRAPTGDRGAAIGSGRCAGDGTRGTRRVSSSASDGNRSSIAAWRPMRLRDHRLLPALVLCATSAAAQADAGAADC